ncbi:hypothetical protein B0I00_1867 [Novosphingobium kunmingense]|uniref:Uncharacterized protein n=1 Tax=Novosphingobium kunmingense TaxID=1211806 RepID=A0A2N0HL64_9SPHN|nr:hypothetical protein [Novosphingobium kunmingense]PKB19628.1 hypothetical protein B0I00_1867 [Novosphingobium kunmingense]
MPFGRAKPRPTLYQLQGQWDDARARERVVAFRTDLRRTREPVLLPPILIAAALCLTAFAVMTPN